jgi:murein DD-endopeptidase MepM/ murein hydrolase activator NlpD
MRPTRPLYLLLPALALVGLLFSAALIWGYKPNDQLDIAGLPTPSSGLPASIGPNSSAGSSGASPTPSPSAVSGSPAPVLSLAKVGPPQSVEPEDLTGYIWPVKKALITSRFAPRDFGGFVIIDGQEVHDGLDIATHCGDKVRAAHGGTVLYAGRNFDPYIGYWGDAAPIYARLERLGRTNEQPIVVVIDDGNGYRSMYVHLQEAIAEAGQPVAAGDIIGLEGMTGFATGCHLHYGMIRMDSIWLEVVPRLAQYGYPPYVRERVDPLRVLPWGDPDAPQKLQDKVNGTPSPSPLVSPLPDGSPAATPGPTSVPTSPPSASPIP